VFGSRLLPIEAGFRSANDLAAIDALFTHEPDAWDSVAEQWLEFDHQHQGSSGTASARLDLYRFDTAQLIASIPIDSTVDWAPQRFDLAAVATFQGGGTYYYTLTQTAMGAGAGFIRIRNVGVRYGVAAPGSPLVEPFHVGQTVGEARPLSLFALWPMKAYPAAGALAPVWPTSLPTKDRYWISMAGRDGTSTSDAWAEVERATLWRWDPALDGGAVSMALEVAGEIVPTLGAGETPRYHLALFYASSGDLVRGSIVDVEVSGTMLLTSGAFLVRPNEDVVAKVRRVAGSTGSLKYVAVRLVVTVTGGASSPLVRSCSAEALTTRRAEVTGATWSKSGDGQPHVHGAVDHRTYLEASMANSGSGGQAEARLRNGATATTLATLVEAGATKVRARSADLRATMEADGVALDDPLAPHDWNGEVDVRGSTAGAKGDVTAAQLIATVRSDPISDLASLGAGWVLFKPSRDADLAAGWKMPSTKNADQAALWRIFKAATVDQSCAWRIALPVNLDRADQWRLLARLQQDQAAQWRLHGVLDEDRLMRWKLQESRNLNRTVLWRLTGARNENRSASWVTIGFTTSTYDRDGAATWRLALVPQLDRAAQWRLVIAGGL